MRSAPEWMTAALAGHFPGVQVDDVAVVLRDDGTNRRARLQLTYSAGAGPATVFAKAVDPEHADLVALTSGLFHEPRLFSSGVVLPLDHPAVYTAIIDEERRDFLMIMEDVVARGADPRDSTRPMTIDQVANGVRGLARMHSEYWGDRLNESPGTRMGRALRRLRRARVRAATHRPRTIGRHSACRDPGAERDRALRRHLGPLHRHPDWIL